MTEKRVKAWAVVGCALLAGCAGATGNIAAGDPVERGLSYVACAIVTAAIIRAFFNGRRRTRRPRGENHQGGEMNWLTRLAMWWIARRMRRHSTGTNSWAWSWHCNIAVCAQDEGLEWEASQKAASRFMRLLFGVDTWPVKK